ncbi:MAG TPA: CPBP family intramembrane glutamic endopeptidase [Polyangiaceae bacterium]|nr:CPBP family intramembrane glutamic endopeptidase [Polyangiaceae bacterium]
MKRVALVFVVISLVNGLSFRDALAGSPWFFGIILVAYLALSLLSLHHFWDEGTLLDRLAPRWGDLSIGMLCATVLLFASWFGRSALAPNGTPRQAWLYRLYIQLGDPELIQHSVWLTAALLVIAITEELVWRGLVLEQLTARLGSRRGWIAAALLYTLSLVPTAFALRDPIAGLNPLLPTAALGAGLVWSFLAARLGRLPPVAISHMVFSYLTAVQFRWPGN